MQLCLEQVDVDFEIPTRRELHWSSFEITNDLT